MPPLPCRRTVPPLLCSSSSREQPVAQLARIRSRTSWDDDWARPAPRDRPPPRSCVRKAAVETTLGAAAACACLREQALVLLRHCSRWACGSANDAVRALLDLTAHARPGAACGSPAALAHHRATGRHLSPESPSTERNLRFFPALWSTRASPLFAGVFARFEGVTRTPENRGVPGSSPGLAIPGSACKSPYS